MTLSILKSLVGEGGYLEKPEDTNPYATAWRGSFSGTTPLVLFPKTTEQVAKIVRHSAKERIPLIPQGGNTGLVGGATPAGASEGAVIVNLSRLNNLRAIDKENGTITVEAGMILAHLQEIAAEHGFLFPLSMASEGSAEVGGILSTNAGGTAVLRYGNTRALTLGLEVVLPDGQIWNGLQGLRKDNTGYDLKQLFIGAEGTLGIITAATFSLFPLPKQQETCLLAAETIADIIQIFAICRNNLGEMLTAFEVISDNAMGLVAKHIADSTSPFTGRYPYYLLVEVSTPQAGGFLRESLECMLSSLFESGKVPDAVLAETLEHARHFWHIREHIAEAIRKEGRGVHFDISLPISAIAPFCAETDTVVEGLHPQLILAPFGHIGDGNLHYNMVLPEALPPAEFALLKTELQEVVYATCTKYGGSISAEHGIGIERKKEFLAYTSPVEMLLMQKVKQALDPEGIMNPGKII